MANNKDAWSALSMKERAEFFKIMVQSGIIDRKTIIDKFNSHSNESENNKFGPGGFMTPIIPSIVEENVVKKPLREAAYRFGSDEEVQQKGYAGINDILRILSPKYQVTNSMDDNKTMFLYGNVNGLPPANNSNGKDFSEYIRSTYPTKDVKSYQGVINPFDEYVIDNRDKGLIEELTKKGKDLYINADTEYVNMGPDDFKYRDDVASYNGQFVNTNNGPAISAADLYDFGPDYNPAKYNEDLSKTDSFLGNLESKLLSYVGTPYILRQDNIPIRFIDYNNASSKDIDRANMLKAAITHGMLSEKDIEKGIDLDSKLAEILGNGYIEPAVVTAESKKANGGKLNSFSGEENTQISNENTKQSKDFLFRWYNNPTTRAIMNKAFPFEKVVPYYNHEGKEFTGELAVRGHIANAIYHTPEYIEKLEDNVGGRYIHDLRNPHIKYNENYVYNNDKVDPRIATHELTHALQYALPQNTLRTSKPVKQELKKGVVPDEYLDSMTEIGARINSFRNALNLTPEKRDYSPEDAETLMNTYIECFGEDATSKLNRFTPETLAGYLNYLAYNDKDVMPTLNSDVNYASNGGRLNVFSGEEDTNKKPFFDPQKIVDNVPAREWGPQIVLGENDYLVKPGTNILAAPIQYYADKNTGKQNIETANKIISDFESLEDKQRHIDEETDTYLAYLDALHYLNHAEALKKYLGLPYDTNRLKESNYKPTRLQGSDEKVYKFSNEEDPKYWGSVVNDMLLGNHNKRQYVDGTLNTFTAYRDFDDKGDFISIYDEWDYNPSVQGGFKPLNKIIDVATGGKPFIVYDRIYLDDYYDVPEAFRGNPYIAPAILTDTNAYMSVEYGNGGKLLTKKQK